MSTSRFRSFSLAATSFWLLVIGGTISTQAQTRSYIVHPPSGTITVLDTETNAVVDTITICPEFTCRPLIPAVTPNGARLYVTNLPSGVSVIDTLTNTVVDTITVGESPLGIAITPDGKRAYVANGSGTISVIDTGTNEVIDAIPDADRPLGIAVTPDGTRAYVCNGRGTVSVVDTSTNTIITNIPLFNRFGFPESNVQGIVVTPDGTRVYVVGFAGKINVIHTMFNSVFETIRTDMGSPLAGGNVSIAVSPDGTRVYTASPFLPAVVIDRFSNTVIAIIRTDGFPPYVGVTPDGTKLYITNRAGVNIFDTSTFTLITRTELEHSVGAFAFATLPEVPHSKDDCKDSGFQRFSVLAFRNQGQCIKYLNEHAN